MSNNWQNCFCCTHYTVSTQQNTSRRPI